MRASVKKWGNSAAVRIPSAIMEAARVELDMAVDVVEENGRVIITPIRQPDFDLDQLLAQITPENVHDEVDFGMPEGKEQL